MLLGLGASLSGQAGAAQLQRARHGATCCSHPRLAVAQHPSIGQLQQDATGEPFEAVSVSIRIRIVLDVNVVKEDVRQDGDRSDAAHASGASTGDERVAGSCNAVPVELALAFTTIAAALVEANVAEARHEHLLDWGEAIRG